ncbi:hypothetical protein HMPREF0476_1048 [Kingella kingae ATCC 23330]|uniref:Uncharacterized protein n=1 Tax=Kingella kingae ATCC 23330 TaxID=887327 RepID=F5S765_KINKI|nr:hypothetical protein HMPREF0476_1048 [Kingella kingae ATCC 23330]
MIIKVQAAFCPFVQIFDLGIKGYAVGINAHKKQPAHLLQ